MQLNTLWKKTTQLEKCTDCLLKPYILAGLKASYQLMVATQI